MSDSSTTVLVVDDNALDRKLLCLHLEKGGWTVDAAADGEEAWEMIARAPGRYEVILLDRRMPRMDGLELLARLKADSRLRVIPVILQTASVEKQEMLEGIRAGAYYYLTKPVDTDMLLEVVRTAANDHAETRELQAQLRQGVHSLRLLHEAAFTVRTIEDARTVGAILANACADPFTAIIGLTELLLNGVEHGNLGITYEEKSVLKTREAWTAEVERRLAIPENAGKRVLVRFERDGERARITIRDDGKGFDAQRYLEIDPQRAFDTHGRGIAMARRVSFESLEYRGSGNEVIAVVKTRTG
ncbi:MAG: response regulator [Thermoanaerobaculia bacterium]